MLCLCELLFFFMIYHIADAQTFASVQFHVYELYRVSTGNYDWFNWKQALFIERIPHKYGKRISCTSFEALVRFGPFGLNAMTKCSTMNIGIFLRSRIGFGAGSHY